MVDSSQLIKIPVKKSRSKKLTAKAKNSSDNALGGGINFRPLAPKGNFSASTKSSGNKKSQPLNIYRKIAVSFIVLTVLLVAVIFYFSLVKVSITLIPNQENITSSLTLDVYDQTKNTAISNNVILGTVKQVEVFESKTYNTTGKEVLGQEVTGKVTIINNYSKNQPLVATTRLLSPEGKLFRIKGTINVPAGGQVEVDVYADQPSQEMAIRPTKFTIPGLWAGLQEQIYGQSQAAMKYSEKVKMRIEQSDIDKATKDLKEGLVAKAKEQINSAFKDYDQVIYEIDNNSITQELDSKIGEEKEQFTLSLKMMVTAVAFADEKIYQFAKEKLASAMPDDKELIEFGKKNITYSLSSYGLSQGIATIKAAFTGKMALREDAEVIDRNKLLGLTNEQLNQYLSNIPEIAGYEIKFYPSFIQKVPNLIDRIKVEIKKE